jgi:hypothetical protein
MPLGSTEPFNLNVKTQNKLTNAQIALGKVALRTNTVTPNAWIQAASAGADGPFCVAVNQTADTTNPAFSAAFAPSEVMVKAGGAIQPGAYVKVDGNGDVVTHVTGTDAEVKIVGRYIGKEGENTPTAAATNDVIRVRLGMG